jgi:hypothetical protein
VYLSLLRRHQFVGHLRPLLPRLHPGARGQAGKIQKPSPAKLTAFTQAQAYATSQLPAYQKSPNNFRETLLSSMIKTYKSLPPETLSLIVYSTLPDQK